MPPARNIRARALCEFSSEASFTKKLFLEGAHVQQQEGAPGLHDSCWYRIQSQLPPINKNAIGHVPSWTSWDDKGESTLLYKPIQRYRLQATLFLFHIKAWYKIQSRCWATGKSLRIEPRFWARTGLEMKIKIEMVQISDFEPHKVGENEILQIGRS